MKRFQQQTSTRRRRKQNLSDLPSGRQTMLTEVPQGEPAVFGEAKDLRQRNREAIETSAAQAGSDTWKNIIRRAGEIAMNKGKRSEETGEKDLRRAKRELLDLETSMWRRWSDYLLRLPEAR